jgi:segregation and condensation protein A
VTARDLAQAMVDALTSAPAEAPAEGLLARPLVTIRDQIGLIAASLRAKGKATFHDLLARLRSRLEIVVTFLAILELVKQQRVVARQEQLFGDIELVPAGSWDPDQEAEFELEFGK